MSVSRGRPSAEGGGRSGSITNHSPSVVSLSYRMPSRLYCGRVILVQTIVLSFESIHPKESQLAEITQFLFQSDTKCEHRAPCECDAPPFYEPFSQNQGLRPCRKPHQYSSDYLNDVACSSKII